MASSTVDGDLMVRGTLRMNAIALPIDCIGDTEMDPADPIQAANLQHQHVERYGQPSGSAATAETKVMHYAFATGALFDVHIGVIVAAIGAATVTVDVKKNGTSVLSAPLTLTSAVAAYGSLPATIATTAYNAGDVFTAVITVTPGSGTLPQGLWVQLVLREAAD